MKVEISLSKPVRADHDLIEYQVLTFKFYEKCEHCNVISFRFEYSADINIEMTSHMRIANALDKLAHDIRRIPNKEK